MPPPKCRAGDSSARTAAATTQISCDHERIIRLRARQLGLNLAQNRFSDAISIHRSNVFSSSAAASGTRP